MPRAFISYRQINGAHSQQVKELAIRLRDAGVEVVLDQFYVDAHAGGPPEGWPKWCSDQASHSEKVLIIASESWFHCFDGKEKPGTGLGAACEAGEFRQRLYDQAGVNEAIRVAYFDKGDVDQISHALKRYHLFSATRDFGEIVRWLNSSPVPESGTKSASSALRPARAATNHLIGLPSRLGERFTGRDLAVLTDLHFAKPAPPGTPPLVLHGAMGVGKTTLAAELLYQLHDAGVIDHAILLPAGDPASVPKLVENLALVLGLVSAAQGPVPPDQARQALAAWFSAPENADRVVLFFDNADTPESRDAVRKEVAAFPMLRVLATSRRSDWPRATLHEVKEWTPPQALDFLGKRLPNASEQDHALLCKELGHLPLALELAAAVIVRLRLDASGLLDRWRTKLKDEKVADRDGNPTVAALLAISLESLAEDPRRLLLLIAQYAPQCIPERLIESTGVDDWREDLALLADASLLEWSNGEIAMHPFIHAATLQGLGSKEALAHWQFATTLLNSYLPAPEWSNRWEEWPLLHPHITAILKAPSASVPGPGSLFAKAISKLVTLAALQYLHSGAYAEAEPLMREALRIDKLAHGQNHPKTAGSLNNLASVFLKANRLAEAEPLLREALRISKAAHGDSHPVVAICLNNLAILLHDTKRFAETEPLLREALSIVQAVHGKDHPDVAQFLNSLALVLRETNRISEAETLMREALRIVTAAFGMDHPQRGVHLNNLAELLGGTGRSTEAEPLAREALRIDAAAFGGSHPNIAIRLNNLGFLLCQTGRLAEAEPLIREALRVDRAALGEDHPSVAIRLNTLAVLLQRTNRTKLAESAIRRSVWIFAKSKRQTGHEHADFRIAYGNYMAFLQCLGYHQSDINRLLRRAIEEEPPDTPESWGEGGGTP